MRHCRSRGELRQEQDEGKGEQEGLTFREWHKPCASRSDAHLLSWDSVSLNLQLLLWVKACESPWGAHVAPLSPPGLQLAHTSTPYSTTSVSGIHVVNFEVQILLMNGVRAGTLPRGPLQTGLVANTHPLPWYSVITSAEILTLPSKVCVWVLTEPGSCLAMIHLPSPSREVCSGAYHQAGSSSVKHVLSSFCGTKKGGHLKHIAKIRLFLLFMTLVCIMSTAREPLLWDGILKDHMSWFGLPTHQHCNHLQTVLYFFDLRICVISYPEQPGRGKAVCYLGRFNTLVLCIVILSFLALPPKLQGDQC